MSQIEQYRRWSRSSSAGARTRAAVVATAALTAVVLALLPTSPAGDDALQAALQPALTAEQAPAVDPVAAPPDQPMSDEPDVPSPQGPAPTSPTSAPAAAASVLAPEAPEQGGDVDPQAAPPPGAAPPSTPADPAPVQTTGAAAAGRAASCAPSREVGVTPAQVRVAAVLLNLGGAIGNGAVGVASPEQQRQMADAVVTGINKAGGVACRRLVVTYFEANPIDAASSRRACLEIAEQGFFGVLDMGGFSYPPGSIDCAAQQRIPIFGSNGPAPSQQRRYGPYYLSTASDPTVSVRASVRRMASRGFFSPGKGFRKLGLYMDDCFPESNAALLRALAEVGQPRDRISIYSFSCPGGGFAAPSDASAAVIRHRQDGVTHVIPETGGGSFKPYSQFAQEQGYKPTYTITDTYSQIITATGATGPDRRNFDGTEVATTTKFGMENSGFTDAATEACKTTFREAGVDPAWVLRFFGGTNCNLFGTFTKAANAAPSLTRPALATGLGRLARVAMSFPQHDMAAQPGKVTGSDFTWVIKYGAACNCWKVVDRSLLPSTS